MKLVVRSVSAALRRHRGNIKKTARALGCCRPALYGFIRARPALQSVLKDCRESQKDDAESVLNRAVRNGESWAVCFYLKTQAKDRGYVERSEVSNVPAGQLDDALERELARLAGVRQVASAGHVAEPHRNGTNGTGHNGTAGGNGTLPH